MPPKKDDKKGAAALTPEEKLVLAEQTMEAEKQNMQVDMAFHKDKLTQSKIEAANYHHELEDTKSKLAKALQDSEDILTHKQREIQQKVERVNTLEGKVKELDAVVIERDEAIARMTQERKEVQKRLDEASETLKEKMALEKTVQNQDALIAEQDEELKKLRDALEEREHELYLRTEECEDLTLKANGSTRLAIFFGEPWLVTLSRFRLHNHDNATDREDNPLTILSPKQIVLCGGQSRVEGSSSLLAANIDPSKMEWDAPPGAMANHQAERHGHTSTAVAKNKLVVIGGRRMHTVLDEVHVLNTDGMKWTTMNLRGVVPQREGHAATLCGERIYIFGGSNGTILSSDIYSLDVEQSSIAQMSVYGPSPTPRRDHTIVASEDGRRLWMFGGNDGGKVLGDLQIFEVERQMWISNPSTSGTPPCARECHASGCIGKYLMIVGGFDGTRKLSDIWALDTETLSWECIDEGQKPNAKMTNPVDQVVNLQKRARYTTFYGKAIISVMPYKADRLDELQMLEFQLPEDLEALKRKGGDDDAADRLELLSGIPSGPNALEVSWRPPTKNQDRVDRYKLMVATNTGVVKEVCQGSSFQHVLRVLRQGDLRRRLVPVVGEQGVPDEILRKDLTFFF